MFIKKKKSYENGVDNERESLNSAHENATCKELNYYKKTISLHHVCG